MENNGRSDQNNYNLQDSGENTTPRKSDLH